LFGQLSVHGSFLIFEFISFFSSSSSVIMGYVAATTVPIMIVETDKHIVRESKLRDPSEWTDIGAFKWWFVTLMFNVMFIIMHAVSYLQPGSTDSSIRFGCLLDHCCLSHFEDLYPLRLQTNFPDYVQKSKAMYAFLIFGINLPWTLSCIRNYIVVPSNQAQRCFVILFDTIVTKPFLRNHLLLQFLSVQGFISSEYFTLVSLCFVANLFVFSAPEQRLAFLGEISKKQLFSLVFSKNLFQ
jgi:hypothetical protein